MASFKVFSFDTVGSGLSSFGAFEGDGDEGLDDFFSFPENTKASPLVENNALTAGSE